MRAFGLTADGHAIHAVTLEWPGGLCVGVLDFGAIVHRIRAPSPDGARDMILGFDTLEEYEADTAYLGAVVGRVANRIANGRFELDGTSVQVSVNEPPNTLHGGKVGFNKRIWRFTEVADDKRSARLTYESPDGEEGFPNAAKIEASFALTAADTLEIRYEATASGPTPLALSHHLYFDLLGERSASILDHRLQIAADTFTPVGAGQIPTGEIAPVGQAFDFRTGRTVAQAIAEPNAQLELGGGGLDLNWVLSPAADPALRLTAPDGVWMELRTDQPGVQVYSGQKLTPPFARFGGLAIEPQDFPDAVNQPDFPDVMLRPGQTYRRRSAYRFGRD